MTQLAQLKFGDDERLLDEAGQWMDESGGHKVWTGRPLRK
jgi:hypothetical protein